MTVAQHNINHENSYLLISFSGWDEIGRFENPKLTLQFWNSSGPGESATFVVWLPWLLCPLTNLSVMLHFEEMPF